MSQEAELQKVKDLLDMGFIHDEEYERRIKEILGNAPIPPAFRVGNSANTVDPIEEERRRQEEELRREMERAMKEEELRLLAEEKELQRIEAEMRAEEIRRREEARAHELAMQQALEQRRREVEEQRYQQAMREAELRREQEEKKLQQAQLRANQPQPTPTTNNTGNANILRPLTPEERRKAIEERQERDKKRWAAEVAEEQRRQSERRERDTQQWGSYDSQASYEPPNLPSFDPNATYSTPEYYAPTGIKLYPIYPPNYFSTVHPFSFIAANKNDPSDQEAVRQKTQEIQRIIEQSKKNPAVNWEEQRRQQEFEHDVQMEQERRAAMQRIIAETPKKPMPAWVDDGIDVNSLPKPTVHIIPMRKWDDSSEPYEAPKYILPSNPNGVIVMQRSEGSVCQTKELNSPTRDSILKMFEMSDGKLINVQTGEEFTGHDTVPSGCYRLEQKLDMRFYRSMGTMPLIASIYTNYNSGGRNSFNLQYERVPSAIADKRNTHYHDNVIFSYGNVRTTHPVHFHSYNESVKPPMVPGNSYMNYSSQPHQTDPNWFKRFREENTKLDYVVCIRNVFRKAGKLPPLRLHRALKDSLDNNKCVVCKQFAQEMLCETHKDERFAELMRSVGGGGNFAEIFGVSTEPTPIEEEVETPIYYKNHGEVVVHDNDHFKAQYIDFSDPNLQPKWELQGMLAERFKRIKENARMTYEMMMNDDFLVHKPGSEQAHLYD